MRKTTLYRTSGTVVAGLVIIVITLAVIRNTAVSHDGSEGATHTHSYQLDNSQAVLGKDLFQNLGCTQCHSTGSTTTKTAPGLKGLFAMKSLPVSGRRVTEENVIKQLKSPYKGMPSFKDRLTATQTDQIIAFLKTL